MEDNVLEKAHQLFKQWFYESKWSFTKLSEKSGISEKILQKHFNDANILGPYLTRLINVMNEEGESQAQELLQEIDEISQQTHTFSRPEDKIIQDYSKEVRSDIASFRAKHVRAIGSIEIDCEITKLEVNPTTCINLQYTTSDCLDCASKARFCRMCLVLPVAHSFIDLCNVCATDELHRENESTKFGTPSIHPIEPVYCLKKNTEILQDHCRSVQNDDCANCPASSRLCTECNERRTYYPHYGTCLKCTLQEWKITLLDSHLPDDFVAFIRKMQINDFEKYVSTYTETTPESDKIIDPPNQTEVQNVTKFTPQVFPSHTQEAQLEITISDYDELIEKLTHQGKTKLAQALQKAKALRNKNA